MGLFGRVLLLVLGAFAYRNRGAISAWLDEVNNRGRARNSFRSRDPVAGMPDMTPDDLPFVSQPDPLTGAREPAPSSRGAPS